MAEQFGIRRGSSPLRCRQCVCGDKARRHANDVVLARRHAQARPGALSLVGLFSWREGNPMTDNTNQTQRPAPLCKECGKAMHRGRTKNPLCRDCERPFCPRCGLERVTTVRMKTCMSCVTADDLRTPRRGEKLSTQAAEVKKEAAKPRIINSCGHQSDLPAHVPPEKAPSYGRWAVKHRLCPHCYARAERQHATNHAVVHQLPPLRGSSKQISWATTIRHAKLREFGNYVDQIGRSNDADREVIGRLRAAQKELAGSTLAATWIEARDLTLAAFVSSCLASTSSV